MAILLGARTLWTSFYCGTFQAIYLFTPWGREVIGMMPVAALAAVIIHTGFELCRPKIWQETKKIGRGQLTVFIITAGATFFVDLLFGIFLGIVAELILHAKHTGYFENPVTLTKMRGTTYVLYVDRPFVFSNASRLESELNATPEEATQVILHFNGGVSIACHTAMERLPEFLEAFHQARGIEVKVIGLQEMYSITEHPSSVKIRKPETLQKAFELVDV